MICETLKTGEYTYCGVLVGVSCSGVNHALAPEAADVINVPFGVPRAHSTDVCGRHTSVTHVEAAPSNVSATGRLVLVSVTTANTVCVT